MVNGVVISGNWAKSEKSFVGTAKEEADTLLITQDNNNCSSLIITADESIDRVTAEIKVTCFAPEQKLADKALKQFSVKAVN